jgi:hypothetical protein
LLSIAGVDGCFIKLTIGQQILAATGRDGNNNIFPIAFGVRLSARIMCKTKCQNYL